MDCQKPPRVCNWRQHLQDFVNGESFSVGFFNSFVALVRVKARRYPAHICSPILVWDRKDEDAYRTIATDVLAHLIEKGLLAKLYYANMSNEEIHAYFKKAVRSYLHSIAKKRGNTIRLFEQVRSILKRSGKFCYFESAPGWGLREWKDLEWDPVPQDILAERIETTVVPARLWGGKRRNRAKVEIFLEAYLKTLGRPVEQKELLRSAQVHFDVYDITQSVWPTERDEEGKKDDQPVEFPDGSSFFGGRQHQSPSLAAETRELAEKRLQLGEQELQLLEDLWLDGRKQKEIVSPGNGKSNVSRRKQQLVRRLQALCITPETIASLENLLREARLKRRDQIYASSKDSSHAKRTVGDPREATAIS